MQPLPNEELMYMQKSCNENFKGIISWGETLFLIKPLMEAVPAYFSKHFGVQVYQEHKKTR